MTERQVENAINLLYKLYEKQLEEEGINVDITVTVKRKESV